MLNKIAASDFWPHLNTYLRLTLIPEVNIIIIILAVSVHNFENYFSWGSNAVMDRKNHLVIPFISNQSLS